MLDGVARMRERPIQDLVDGLVALGVDAACTMGTGCPPVEVNAKGLPTGQVYLPPCAACCSGPANHIHSLTCWMIWPHTNHAATWVQIRLNGSVSSQFLTAILMAAPQAEGEGAIEIMCEDLISQPYVDMTIKLMERFNVKVQGYDAIRAHAPRMALGVCMRVSL